MSAKNKENAALVGVGLAACALCCAGPILGVLAAIGLGTAAGYALFGTVAIVIGAVVIAFVLVGRRRRVAACAVTDTPESVPVETTGNSDHVSVEVGRNERTEHDRFDLQLGVHAPDGEVPPPQSVHTGTYCSYTPDPLAPILWHI